MGKYLIFLTNLPSFYKINLFNEINKSCRVLAIFTGESKDDRNADFFKGNMSFENVRMTGGNLRQCLRLMKILRQTDYDRLIISGWDRPQMLWASLVSPRKKNVCIVESSIYDSRTTGWRSWVKRFVLSRMTTVFPSGELQEQLVRALGYKGESIKWGGCGLLNYQPQPSYEERKQVKRFLYVGRLAPEKNLELLIDAFRCLPQLMLTIVGFGPLEQQLKVDAPDNVTFTGAIDNALLPDYYKSHDVFVLPSKSEPWGLVVEEALNNGTPVIVSDRVGCKDDLVTQNTGLVFHSDDIDSLCSVIEKITDVRFYNSLRFGVSKLNFAERARRQVESFIRTGSE